MKTPPHLLSGFTATTSCPSGRLYSKPLSRVSSAQLHKPLKSSLAIIPCCFILFSCSVEQQTAREPIAVPEIKVASIEKNFLREEKIRFHEPPKPQIPVQQPDKIPTKPPLTDAQRFAGVLASHNRVRAKHHLQPLKWSNKLANYSQDWANRLGAGNRCTMRHRSGTPPYGENLYWSSAVVWTDGKRELHQVSIKDVVKAWTDEERWYDYNSNRCQPGKRCGHYTQIVWRDTTEVGCAMKICADKSQSWVCSYNPPGNFTGVRPY